MGDGKMAATAWSKPAPAGWWKILDWQD